MQTCFSQTHISYILGNDEHVSGLGMKMLGQINSPVVLSIGELNYNGADKLICNTRGYECIASGAAYLSEANRLNIAIGLAKLIKTVDENTFLDREFIKVDRDNIFINPETGMPGFVILPVADNSTGSLRRVWLEDFFGVLSFLYLSCDEVKDDSLKELITLLEKQILKYNQDGEHKIPDLVEILNFFLETFSEMDYRASSDKDSSFDEQREVRLVYSGRYGNFSLFVLNNKFLIGKTNDCDGKLTFNQAISRRHGEISIDEKGCFYTDLGSSNHSYLNRNLLNPNTPYQISDGDILRLADMDFRVQIMQKAGGNQ